MTDPTYLTGMQQDDPGTSAAGLTAAYAAGGDQLHHAVAGLAGDQLTARPVAGKWSTLEVVAHVADAEVYFADRILRALALDKPLLVGVDEGPYPERLHYQQLHVADELALVEALRRRVAGVLRHQPAEAWQRSAVHTEAGLVTVRQLVFQAVRHLRHHLPFLAEKRTALGVPA